MSQIYKNLSSGGGSGIQIIDGDTGSITGSTVTIFANNAVNHSGGSVSFTNSGTVSTLNLTNSGDDTFLGKEAGAATSGGSNTSVGFQSLDSITTGRANTALGFRALEDITIGGENLALGANSLNLLISGEGNIALGKGPSGNQYNNAESYNIIISNDGVVGESNVIRIGTQGSSNFQQNTCYIAGITGSTVTGSAVLCSTSGQLGTIASSERYKENISPLPDDVTVLNLQPVNFTWKKDPSKITQTGLIAEDVEKKFPYLCLYNDEGKPESVKYHELPVFLLAEIQRLNKRIEMLEKAMKN